MLRSPFFRISVRATLNFFLPVSEQSSFGVRADTKVTHLWASSPECRAHWRLQIGCCYVCGCRKQVWFAPPQVYLIRHCNSKGSSYRAPSCDLIELYSAQSNGIINHQVPLGFSLNSPLSPQTMPCKHRDTSLHLNSQSSCMNIYYSTCLLVPVWLV